MREPNKFQRRLWLCLVILSLPLAVFLIFGRALIQGFAPIDDILLVTQNLAAHGLSWEHIRLAFTTFDPELYIPLTLLSFQLDYTIAGGLNPQIFHTTNLVLHALNAILVAVLLKKLTGSRWGSLFGGLLFAVHPLHTEAVVWIAGRKDLLFAFFSLLSLVTWTDRERGHWRTALAIGFLFLALLAKVTAVIVLPLWVMIDLYRGKRWKGKAGLRYVPGLILCLAFGIVSFGGKERVLGSQPIVEVIMTGFRSIWFFVLNFFAPLELAISHEWVGGFSFANTELWLGIIVTIGVTVAAWRLRHREPWLLFGWAFFLLALAPTFLGSQKGGMLLFAVDRYGYIPSIGLVFCLIMLARWLNSRMGGWRGMTAGIAMLLIVVAGLLTREQVKAWDSPEALFGQALSVTPNSVGSRVSLASVLLQGNDIQGAFNVLKEGLRYGDHPELHLVAGQIYAKAGDTASAREEFSRVLIENPLNPDALFSLASLDEQEGSAAAALAGYRKAVDIDPSFVSARNGIARISMKNNDDATAERELTTSLEWNPSSGEAHRLMGQLLEKKADFAAAESHYRDLLSIEGESAETLLSLARVLLAQKEYDEAKVHIKRVLEVEPRNAEGKALLRSTAPTQ